MEHADQSFLVLSPTHTYSILQYQFAQSNPAPLSLSSPLLCLNNQKENAHHRSRLLLVLVFKDKLEEIFPLLK